MNFFHLLKFAFRVVLLSWRSNDFLLQSFFKVTSFHYLLIYDSTQVIDAVYGLEWSFIFRFISLKSNHLLNRISHLDSVNPSALRHLRIIHHFMVFGGIKRSYLPKLRIKIETLKLLDCRVRNLIELPLLGCGGCSLLLRQVLISLTLEMMHQGLGLRSCPVRLLIQRWTMLEWRRRKVSWDGRHLWVCN